MKRRVLVVVLVGAISFLFTGVLYAANGDLIVNGNLGVGTTTPAAKAEVNGNMIVGGTLTVQGNLVTNGSTTLGGSTTTMTGNAIVNGNSIVNGNLGVGTSTPAAKAQINGNAIVNGNLGVGTSTPTQKLDVNGKVKATGYYSGSSAGLTVSVSAACPWGQSGAVTLTFTGGILTGYDGSCYFGSSFRAGALVLMADGTKKPIEQIKVGEFVAGANSSNKVLGFANHKLGNRSFYSINGAAAFVTEDHPFMTTAGWKSINPTLTAKTTKTQVSGLKIGDVIKIEKGTEVVKSITATPAQDQTVYNLVLSGDKTYYAGGYLVMAYNDAEQAAAGN